MGSWKTVGVSSLDTRRASCEIEFLAWDTSHFGLRVGRLVVSSDNAPRLESQLKKARDEGYQLLYLVGPSQFTIPPSVAEEYGATLVDRKTTYRAQLECLPSHLCKGVTLEEYPEGPASAELIELGMLAGRFSRFFTDARMPRPQAEHLYAVWVDESARRLLADCVIVARVSQAPATLGGMITVSATRGLGTIGLLAVSEAFRGRGVGTALVHAAHDWMRARGAHVAEVVTQGANAAAHHLYTRCGYAIVDVRNVYHCWLTQ